MAIIGSWDRPLLGAALRALGSRLSEPVIESLNVMKSLRLVPSLAVLVAAWFAIVAAQAQAATVQLSPTRDTTLLADNANASNGSGPVFFAGLTGPHGGAVRRALVYFDVTAIPAGATVTSVSLVLSVTREPGSAPLNGTLRRILASWGEAGSSSSQGTGAAAQTGDATWSHRFYGTGGQTWTTAGGDLAAATSATASFGAVGTKVTFGSSPQLVADVQAWVNHPATNQGWAILGDETTATSATQFAARENSNAALRPSLSITYSPPVAVPASPLLGLVVAAALLLGLGAFHLRRCAG